MTVDVRGTHHANLGAVLMLEAVAERLAPHFDLSASPFAASWDIRARLGLRQTLHDYNRIRLANMVGNTVPGALKDRYGLASDRDITGVVDASGFAYSDSFGFSRQQREATYGRTWAKRNIPKVMLPQAFGPFDNSQTAKWTTEVVSQSDLVFARDAESLAYLRSLGTSTRVEVSPDFTIGLHPEMGDLDLAGHLVLVPNEKIVQQDILGRADYLHLMTEFGAHAKDAGASDLTVIVHENNDLRLGHELAGILGCQVHTEASPRLLKYALGTAQAVVGSRYHAIVSALSQGIPTIAVGWSHKYPALMSDFSVPELLWSANRSAKDLVRVALNDSNLRGELEKARNTLVARNEQMWIATIAALRG